MEEVCRRLSDRAKNFGMPELVERIKTLEGQFSYKEFLSLCKALCLNPALVLSNDYQEVRFSFVPKSEEERKLLCLVEEVIRLYENRKKGSAFRGAEAELFREFLFAKDRPLLDPVEFCRRVGLEIIILGRRAPVDGFYALSRGAYLVFKKGANSVNSVERELKKLLKEKGIAYAEFLGFQKPDQERAFNYSVNKFLSEEKEVLYAFGTPGEFYKSVKTYLWIQERSRHGYHIICGDP